MHSAAAAAELARMNRDRPSIEHSEAMRLHSNVQFLQGIPASGHPGSSGPTAHHLLTSRMSPFGPRPGCHLYTTYIVQVLCVILIRTYK